MEAEAENVHEIWDHVENIWVQGGMLETHGNYRKENVFVGNVGTISQLLPTLWT